MRIGEEIDWEEEKNGKGNIGWEEESILGRRKRRRSERMDGNGR